MEIISCRLDGVKLVRPPTIHEDFRGSYVELYNRELYRKHGIEIEFVQDDISVSSKNVLRGIHGDGRTWKLVSCLMGRFYLVVVNWDPAHPQHGQWESFTLSDANRLQALIPPRFGNGHLVLSDFCIFHYKQSAYYDRESQFTLAWNDPALGIWWPIRDPITSERDKGISGPGMNGNPPTPPDRIARTRKR